MKITFDIKNQIITRTDANRVIANSSDYIEAEFSFSDDWENLVKTANFVNGDVTISIPLSNNAILPSKHLNLGIGTWKVSVTGVLSEKKIETNAANVTVKSSGSIKQAGPTSDVYQDLLVIVSELQTVAASDAVIRAAVEDYIEENITIILSDATKEEIMQQVINAPQLVDKLSLTMYAQRFPFDSYTADWSGSGICIAKKNNVEYIVECFVKSNNAQQVVKISNLATGAVVATKTFTTLGHANGCAYDSANDLIYVATSGGEANSDTVVALNWDLSVSNTYTFEGDKPYGISVCGNYIYMACNGGKIKKLGKNFVVQEVVNFSGVEGSNAQTLIVDEHYFYMPFGQHISAYDESKVMFEGIGVYRHDGSFYKMIFADTAFEIESFDFCDGGIVVACTSLGRHILFKSSIYCNTKVYHSDTDNWVNNIMFTNNVQNVYVNESYTGYLMDGTQSHPVSDVRLASGNVWRYANTLNINCLGDIATQIGIVNCTSNIVINGNNHNFAGLYFDNVRSVQLNDIVVTSRAQKVNALVGIVNVKEAVLTNLNFNGSAYYTVYNSGSNVAIVNSKFSVDPTNYVLHCRRGGTFRLQSTTQESAVTKFCSLFSGENVFDATSFVPCVYGSFDSAEQSNAFSLNAANHNNKSVFDFKLKGYYSIPSTVTLTNGPTLASGESLIGLHISYVNSDYAKYVAYVSNGTTFAEKVSYFKKSNSTHSNWA